MLSKNRGCAIPDCARPHYSDWLCEIHHPFLDSRGRVGERIRTWVAEAKARQSSLPQAAAAGQPAMSDGSAQPSCAPRRRDAADKPRRAPAAPPPSQATPRQVVALEPPVVLEPQELVVRESLPATPVQNPVVREHPLALRESASVFHDALPAFRSTPPAVPEARPVAPEARPVVEQKVRRVRRSPRPVVEASAEPPVQVVAPRPVIVRRRVPVEGAAGDQRTTIQLVLPRSLLEPSELGTEQQTASQAQDVTQGEPVSLHAAGGEDVQPAPASGDGPAGESSN